MNYKPLLGIIALLLMVGLSDAGDWWRPVSTGGSGSNGINGVNGTNGVDGVNGINGTNGMDGLNGSSGSQGIPGVNGVNGTFDPNIEILSFGNISGARLRLAGNYSASPSNPPRGQCDIMFIDNGLTPVIRFRCNSSNSMKVADVALA